MSGTSEIPDSSALWPRLARLDRRTRLAALVNGLGITALLLAAIIGIAVASDLLWDMPIAVRLGFLATAAAAVLCGGIWAVHRAFLRRRDAAAVAALLESTYPQLHERLSSIAEWERQDLGSGSPLMRQLVIREAHRDLEQLNVDAPVPLARATRRGTVGLAVLAVLLLPCLFLGGYRLLLARFATPWRNLERAANLYFVVEPGDATVARGSDVEITAAPNWRVTRTQVDAATLVWQDATGRRFERQMNWDGERSMFTASIAHVLEPFHFEIRSGRTRTREFHVDVVDRPSLIAVTAIIEPPAYTGRALEEIPGAVGDLEMLRGSRLVLQMRFSLPVEQAELVWSPEGGPDDVPESTIAARLAPDGLSAEADSMPESNGQLTLRAYDRIGVANPREPARRIIVVSDAAPRVRFVDQNSAARAAPREVLRLPVAADDDIGLALLELHYEVVGDAEQSGSLPAGNPVLGMRAAQETFALDLGALKLSEGAIVAVRARAADECTSPAPNEAWTPQRLITISEQADPYESSALAQQQQELLQALQRLRTQVSENRQATEALRSHAVQQEQAIDRNDELAKLAEQDRAAATDAGRVAAMLDLHPLLAPLGDRTRQVAGGPLKLAGEQTAAAQTAGETGAMLSAADEQLARAETELESIQRDLEQLAALEQDLLELQRLADDAERLAQDVAKYRQSVAAAQESSSAEPDPLAPLRELAADQLRSDHADLSQRLDKLLDRRPELVDAAVEHSLDRLESLRDAAQLLAGRERQLAGAIEVEQEFQAAESNAATPETSDKDATVSPLEELLNRQSQLAERAVQIAHAATGKGETTAQATTGIAAQSIEVAENLQAGDLTTAARSARQLAERAAQAARDGHGVTEAEANGTDLLAQLAADQQAVADQLDQAAASPAARSAARRESQQRINERTQRLQSEFAQVAEELAAEPVARGDEAERASASSAATRQAQESMQASLAGQTASDKQAATAAAQQAAAHLDEAAEQVRPAVENSPDSPVPTEVGQQVAHASRQLRKAGEQLGGSNMPQESEGAGAENAQASEAGASQPAPGQDPMSDDSAGAQDAGEQSKGGEGEPSQDGPEGELARAAAALQAAARRLKPRTPEDESAAGESSAARQSGGEQPSEGTPDGAGTAETVRLTDLAARIKARSMRNWGELPGELQSELQQRSQSRPDAEYAPLIRMYFNEISRRQSPAIEENP